MTEQTDTVARDTDQRGADQVGGAPPTVLVVVNSEGSGPRRFKTWLEAAGVRLDEKFGGDGLPANLAGYAGLVMLGGGLLPDEYESAPWLRQEGELAKQAIEADLPTLGICLGGQILAHVAGGEVRGKYGAVETGATLISLTEAARGDTVVGAMGPQAHMIENHQDQITRLPDGAVHLARSREVENQAFRLGTNVWGVQFHPETGAEHLASWSDAALKEKGLDLVSIQERARAVDGENTQASQALALGFARQVQNFWGSENQLLSG